MKNTFPYLHFLKLHKALFTRMFFFDFILGISGSLFLLIPLDNYSLSLSNLTILVLFIFATVVYQIHLFRTYAGGVTFYLNLPIKRYCLFVMMLVDAIVPLLITVVSAMMISVFPYASQTIYGDTQMLTRAYYIMLLFFILKTIALPVFTLYIKHIALIMVFLLSVTAVYALLAIIAELLHINSTIFGLLFLVCLEIICVKIVSIAKAG